MFATDGILEFIKNKSLILPGLLIALTLHELAHGYVSYLLGDPTAKKEGRITLNPIKHIDPIGFLLLFTVGFGWAKAVPINTTYYRNRKLGTILVSLAGVVTNFVLAAIGLLVLSLTTINNEILFLLLYFFIFYNVILGVFNLIPLPPLDGSKLVASLLPTKYEYKFYKYERYLYFLLIAFIITDGVDFVLNPVIQLLQRIVVGILY